MERLRSLIKEVLTVKPKEDCGCGCNDCGGKAPIITEGRIKKAISEGLTYHVENKIPLHESVYRIGSEKHFELINEARKLWVRGLIDVSEDDQAILETHLGNFGMYEGEKVPLDMPMVHEGTFQGNEIAIYGGEDGETYIEKRGTGYYGYNNSFDFTAKDKAELEQKLNMWGYYPIAGSINEEDNRKHALLRVEPRNYEAMIDKLQDMNINHRRESDTVIKVYIDNLSDKALYNLTHDVYVDKFVLKESLNEEKAITFKPGTLSDMELATKILDKEGIEYKIDNFDLILSDEDYLVVLDYLKGRNSVNVNLSTSILNEEKDRAREIMNDLFGYDFEFSFTYKSEGNKIVIDAEGYNDDGTLFDMKDVHKEKIIRTFRDKMPKAVAKPNMGGGITVFLKESLDEDKELEKDYIEHLQNIRNDFYNKGDKEKAAEVQADIDKLLSEDKKLPNGDIYLGQDDKGNHKIKSKDKITLYNNEDMVLIYGKGWGHNLDEVDRYSGFNRNPEDPDSVPFEPKGSVAQFREELRALFGKFKGDLKNPEFIKGVAEIMVNWKSLLRSQLDEAKKKKKKKKKDPPIGKPKRGGSKAYYVYVRDPKTKKIKKVSFGSGGLRAKIKNAEARKRFAARHNCKNKKDRTTAGYWSCNLPRYAEQLGLGSKMNTFW